LQEGGGKKVSAAFVHIVILRFFAAPAPRGTLLSGSTRQIDGAQARAWSHAFGGPAPCHSEPNLHKEESRQCSVGRIFFADIIHVALPRAAQGFPSAVQYEMDVGA
jgi:hypothetical protein